MIILSLLSLLVSSVTGYWFLALLLSTPEKILKICLGILVGFALHAFAYQGLLIAKPAAGLALLMFVDALLLVGSGILWWYWCPKQTMQRPLVSGTSMPDMFMACIVLLILLLALAGVWQFALFQPTGQADAISFWNLKAKFLAAGGVDWRLIFDRALSQADYPLLLPMGLARGWRYAGDEMMQLWPMFFSVFSTGLLLLLVYAAVGRTQSRARAALAALIVVGGSPFLLLHSAAQYADHLYACYLLAAMIVIDIANETKFRKNWVLAGLLAGMAAATKNEGLVLCATLCLVCVICLKPRRNIAWIILGMCPFLLWTIWVKLQVTGVNPLFIQPVGDGPWQRLWQWDRHLAVLQTVWQVLCRDYDWRMLILLASLPMLVGLKRNSLKNPMFFAIVLVLLLNSIAYELVFAVLSYGDVRVFASEGINRVSLHLWPLVVWFIFRFMQTSHLSFDDTAVTNDASSQISAAGTDAASL
jgi:hypothetical protein